MAGLLRETSSMSDMGIYRQQIYGMALEAQRTLTLETGYLCRGGDKSAFVIRLSGCKVLEYVHWDCAGR